MNKFISFIKQFRIPKKEELSNALKSLPKKRFYIFGAFSLIAIISLIIILSKLNNSFMVEVPTSGGTITEGVISVPTLVNPVLAISEIDKDLTKLIYSGLTRKDAIGEIIPDLAESFEVSQNKLTYTFILKDNLVFHDGEKVTTDDIEYTINKINHEKNKFNSSCDFCFSFRASNLFC